MKKNCYWLVFCFLGTTKKDSEIIGEPIERSQKKSTKNMSEIKKKYAEVLQKKSSFIEILKNLCEEKKNLYNKVKETTTKMIETTDEIHKIAEDCQKKTLQLSKIREINRKIQKIDDHNDTQSGLNRKNLKRVNKFHQTLIKKQTDLFFLLRSYKSLYGKEITNIEEKELDSIIDKMCIKQINLEGLITKYEDQVSELNYSINNTKSQIETWEKSKNENEIKVKKLKTILGR